MLICLHQSNEVKPEKSESDTKKETDEKELSTPENPAVDTTDQHRNHLFDLNCKVCTGKVPPPAGESAVKKLKVAHKVMGEGGKKVEKPTNKQEDLSNAEEVVKEVLRAIRQSKTDAPASSTYSGAKDVTVRWVHRETEIGDCCVVPLLQCSVCHDGEAGAASALQPYAWKPMLIWSSANFASCTRRVIIWVVRLCILDDWVPSSPMM